MTAGWTGGEVRKHEAEKGMVRERGNPTEVEKEAVKRAIERNRLSTCYRAEKEYLEQKRQG